MGDGRFFCVVNNNLAKYGIFCNQDADLVLGASNTIIPFTRTVVNQDAYYTVNANGTITLPAGSYIVTLSIHGIHEANYFVSIEMYCGNSIASDVDHWTVREQFKKSLTLCSKSTSAMTVQVIGRSLQAISSIYGYLIAIDTKLTIQKLA